MHMLLLVMLKKRWRKRGTYGEVFGLGVPVDPRAKAEDRHAKAAVAQVPVLHLRLQFAGARHLLSITTRLAAS
jgi:hypothetical protein